MNLMLIAAVSYQLSANLPLKHDGYVVEREVDQGHSALSDADCRMSRGGQQAYDSKHCERFVVKAATERAFLYANYESNRWMNAKSYPFVRDPHFAFRALDVGRSPEPLRDWIAATGANAVYLKRGRPDAKLLRECAELGVPAYGFLYGCDAAKWNREKYDAFIAAHPSAKGVTPPKSWEKGTLCPSDPATREFFKEAILEIVGRGTRPRVPALARGRATLPDVAGVVVCLWDNYGLNCVCDRCRANGMAGNWGRQVAFAVKAWEEALNPLGKELIVRTWASGASHWLRDEWVHAPGYGGPSGDPLSVWGEASSGEDAAAFVMTAKPDVLLLDIRMPGKDGIETLGDILAAKPSQKVVMLTTSDADDEVFRALNNGARGYLLKDRDSDAICMAVKTVHAGSKFIPDAVKAIYRRRQMMSEPTPREREVLELVADGLSNDEVAGRLGISYESVKVHMKHLLFKFEARDRTELVSAAIRGGFVKDVPAKR